MEEANKRFENLRSCINGEVNADKDNLLKDYQTARNKISKESISREQMKWNEVTTDSNSKRMWEKIDWKGNVRQQVTESPIFDKLTNHFENLYKSSENEADKLEELMTNTYVPSLDDPITNEELNDTMKDMKKGGFDHRIDFFKIMIGLMSPLFLMLLNIMFYISYPTKLAISLLNAIPKSGNLLLPSNFRGIQMLPALGNLFDRIIYRRLEKWLTKLIHHVQSGFQKGKSTLHQIFTIRLLIEIAKMTNTTLYIGMFDLAKAFDKVSRLKLLQKLILLGIGKFMLNALKRLYSFTCCTMIFGKQFSRKFRTTSGIRQGAASSALLFIAFINDLVDYLSDRCTNEPLLDDLHCLLHADDTAILSTNRELFTIKCNHMLDYFEQNSLSLNLSKSGYMIINAKPEDLKTGILLKNGILEYKSKLKYLGVFISDTGKIKEDVLYFVNSKRSNLTIKFGNFCRKNFLAPLLIKLKVLNTCVNASVTYACETWGVAKIKEVETMFRQGIKSALSVRESVNNEIVYVESGERPLEIRIAASQIKFWSSLCTIQQENPNHYISKLLEIGGETEYVKYYKRLHERFIYPSSCVDTMRQEFTHTISEKIQRAADDPDSRLGCYLRVNPELSSPMYTNELEFKRVCITRYRTGSHNLRIEKDRRIPYSNREDRLCSCNNDIQTIQHVLLHCPLLNRIREKYGIVDVVNGINSVDFLIEMECILNIKC